MSVAQVLVLHETIIGGVRLFPSQTPVEMDADEARKAEASGHVDVLSVDGQVEVWQPCCGGGGEHSHA